MTTRTTTPRGPSVRSLGLGLAALGRPGYLNLGHGQDVGGVREVHALEARCHEVLDAAWAAGIRYVDAARSYGLAEAFLGTWLERRGVPPGALTVASKWGYTYTAGWRVDAERHEVKDHSLGTYWRQFQESRGLLGEHLRVYQIHSATLESGVLDDAAVTGALATLRDAGVRVGLTLSGPRQADTLRRALELAPGGRPLFSSVLATWNVLEPSVSPALAEAHARGLSVVVKEALANGRLTARNARPEDAARLAVLSGEAARLGTTPDALALAAALAQPWASVVLSGAATVEQLHGNLGAVAVRYDEQAARALGALAGPADAYWAERARLPWT